jgi:uncharacterized protein (TIGR03437 family)
MKRSVRRYPLALLFSLLLLSGFTSFTGWAHQALGITISKSANYLGQALTQPAKPGDQGAIAKPVQQPNDSTETALEPAQGNFTIPQNVLPGGGGVSTGGTNTLLGTIGQGIVGTSSGGNFTLSGGFLGAVDQCPTITITPATLANGQLGQPYSQQLTQSGSTGQIMWSISAGNLPNNVTLNPSTGLLSGLAVASGSFPFTVRAADASGCAGTQSYTMVIGSCPAINIMPASLPAATSGTPYSQTLTASGGTPPYRFSLVGEVRPWLSLTENGTLTSTLGTLVPVTVTVMVKATDAAGCSGTRSYTLTIKPGPITVSGRVRDLSGKGLAGVTLAFSNPTLGDLGAVQTDANGRWTRGGFEPIAPPDDCGVNPYVVKVSKAGYSFAPSSMIFCVSSATLDFTGTLVVTTVSAADFRDQELAQESIVAAFGLNLATRVEIANSTPLPTTLAGTTVKIKDSAGTERNAPLFFVAPSQINYQIPPGTVVGAATVTVTTGDSTLSVGTINVSRVVPGLFTANASGRGVPAAQLLRIRNGLQTFESVSRADFSAIPIDLGPETDLVYLLLFGVGARNRTSAQNISVDLGETVKTLNPAIFEDAFAAPGFVGLDQVNVLLPRSLAGKGNINVTVTVDGKPSNTVLLNIK